MSLRDDLLPVFEDARELIKDLGLRQTRVVIRTRTYASGITGEGSYTDSDLELGGVGESRPKVEELGEGRFHISKITPAFPGGGWTVDQLLPPMPKGTEVYVVLIDPDGQQREKKIVDAQIRKSFGYTLLVEDRK